jgi:hypothetical protein
MSETQEQTKVCHFGQRQHKQSGSFTIATRLIDNEAGTAIVEYGVAFCSPKDTFCKKIGNRMANQRLENTQQTGIFEYSGLAVAPQKTHIDVVFAVLSSIASMNIMPDWARILVLDELIHFGIMAADQHVEHRKQRRKQVFTH